MCRASEYISEAILLHIENFSFILQLSLTWEIVAMGMEDVVTFVVLRTELYNVNVWMGMNSILTERLVKVSMSKLLNYCIWMKCTPNCTISHFEKKLFSKLLTPKIRKNKGEIMKYLL